MASKIEKTDVFTLKWLTIYIMCMKRSWLYILSFAMLLLAFAVKLKAENGRNDVFDNWQAGQQVTLKMVETYGIERCFAIDTINDKVFARMWKKSYKEDCTIPRKELRYIRVLHYTQEGNIRLGELVCNKDIAQDLVEIFRELFDAKYPIERMVLIDNYDAQDQLSMAENNTSCFNFRFVGGTKKLSNHSQGRAIDINALYNPYVKRRSNGTLHVEPAAGRAYADRTKRFKYKIDRSDLCYKLFIKHGFRWGGDWKSVKDYQHFEKTRR